MIHSAHIILYDSTGRVLLQQRSDASKDFPNIWGFFGGRCEESEDPLLAVKRELKEELEYKLKSPKFFITDEVIKKRHGKLARFKRFFFIERCANKNGMVLHEGQGLGWFSLATTKHLLMLVADRIILAKAKKYIK